MMSVRTFTKEVAVNFLFEQHSTLERSLLKFVLAVYSHVIAKNMQSLVHQSILKLKTQDYTNQGQDNYKYYFANHS